METLLRKPQGGGIPPQRTAESWRSPFQERQVLAILFLLMSQLSGLGCNMQAQSPIPFVKLLFRNLPNISLYIHTHRHHMGFVARVTRPQCWPLGCTKGQVPGAITPLLQKNAETNVIHQFITYSTTLTESAGPAHRNTALCTWAGASLRRGPRTIGITSTTRPPPKAEIVVG